MNTGHIFITACLATVVAILAAAPFLAVFGSVFSRIELDFPHDYDEAAAAELAQGNLDAALALARRASHALAFEPGPHVLTGDILRLKGKPGEAQGAYQRALYLRLTSSYARTLRPFYYPPARAPLADLALEAGRSALTVHHLELARPLLIKFPESLPQHAANAYAAAGLPGRRLELMPEDAAYGEAFWAEAEEAELRRLAHACEAAGEWQLLEELANALGQRPGLEMEAAYARGRAAAGRADWSDAAAWLEKAAKEGHPWAPYFLGAALSTLGRRAAAQEAFIQTPDASPYRPFALSRSGADGEAVAKAWRMLRESPAGYTLRARSNGSSRRELPLWVRPFTDGTTLLVLSEWNGASAATLSNFGLPLHLQIDGRVIQLAWATDHLLPLEAFAPRSGAPPGWTDASMLGAGETAARAASRVEMGPDGAATLAIEAAEPGFPRLYSAPLLLERNRAYALWGDVSTTAERAALGWHFIDDELFAALAYDYENVHSEAWTEVGLAADAQFPWAAVRAVAGVPEGIGEAFFRNLHLVELAPPSATGASADGRR